MMVSGNVRGPVPSLDVKLLRDKKCVTMILKDGRKMRCRILEVGRYNIHVTTGTAELFIPKGLIKYYVLKEHVTGEKDWENAEPFLQETISINTGSIQELSSLSGLGRTIAERVVAYREKNGPFKSKEKLMQIKGIGKRRWGQVSEM